jgi:UDP-N-acetylglucosamine diphosphorylase/glucosamine-1-phosphate N-acetyltransferase
MRVCLFEDSGVNQLEPLTLTRPVFDLLCGRTSLARKQVNHVAAQEIGVLVRPYLAAVVKESRPSWFVNDYSWLHAAPTMLINGRWLPPSQFHGNPNQPHLGMLEDEIAYAVLNPPELRCCVSHSLDDCLETWFNLLPKFPAGGQWIRYSWDLVEFNPQQLIQDFNRYPLAGDLFAPPENFTVVGPRANLVVARSANIDPYVVFDTTQGPIVVADNATITAFSRIEGPCYIGKNTQVQGAKIRCGTTLGEQCRIGGEVEASIIQGHSNKYHEGFLGHSYLGEWVNLGAGTHNSDLRNDYGEVSVVVLNQLINSGLKKVGCFIGDHSKTGLGTLINTGSNIGAFCNLLPAGRFAPKYMPSFVNWWKGSLEENFAMNSILATTATVMNRRGCSLTDALADMYRKLFDETSFVRHRVLQEAEKKAITRSA